MKTIKELGIKSTGSKLNDRGNGYLDALKDVSGLILLRIKALKVKQKEVTSPTELYGLECMIAELEELKKRISG